METFVDMFCGGGLGARGAVQAGMQPILAADLWDIACQTYEANYPGAVVLNERIEKIQLSDYRQLGSPDLLLASPECTNHSVAKGSAPRDEQSKETALLTADWIEALRPKWFVIENVKEMRTWGRYGELLQRLAASGYQMKEEVINAADFGAPQSRVRLFLIGGLNMTPPAIVPGVGTGILVARDMLDPDGTWPMRPVFTARRAKSTLARVTDAIQTLGEDAEFLLVYYGSGGDKSWQTLDQPLRTITTVDRFALVKKRHGEWVMRMLQPTELAKAMSLPPEHVFPVGSRRERVKVCGNGVCATVVRRIVELLRKATQEHEEALLRPTNPVSDETKRLATV